MKNGCSVINCTTEGASVTVNRKKNVEKMLFSVFS